MPPQICSCSSPPWHFINFEDPRRDKMFGAHNLDTLFVVSAFVFQGILIIHFALRKWHFDLAMRYGWVVYALGIPAALLSMVLLLGGKVWSLWLSGFIYLIWAIYGYIVEYIKRVQWRSPARWSILGPYVFLYLAAVMFYWWPLALIYKPLWYVYAVLFIASTYLNVTSHKAKRPLVVKESSI